MKQEHKIILKTSLIWVLLIIAGILIIGESLEDKQEEIQEYGLRIDKEYIKSVSGQEAYVNDVYVTQMILFSDKCNSAGGNQSFYRIVDSQNRVYGVALWCQNLIPSFTFYYSNKWRQENYGKK